MKLRTKGLFVIGTTLTTLSLFVFSMVGIYTYRSYRRLEQQFVKGEVTRIEDILQRELKQLDRTTIDYAHWTDTYNYMVNPNPEYTQASYDPEVLKNLQINRISLIKTNKLILFDRWFNYAPGQQVKQTFPELEIKTQMGFWVCQNGQIFIISMHPILPSDKVGQPRGWLRMARLVDDYKLKQISQEAGVKLKIYSPDKDALEPKIQDQLTSNQFAIKPIDWHQVAGYTTIKNFEGKPQFILEVISNRYIYQQFVVGTKFLGIAILTIGICTTLVILILLDRLFLSRLSLLDSQVQNIKANPEVIPELELSGKDELVDFSTAINQMMKVLEKARIAVATNKVKNEFMAIMSHELRTPLNAILGMGQLLQLTELNSEQKEYIDTILESGNNLLILLSDILNYVKLEPEQLQETNVNLETIFAALKEKYQLQAKVKGINLICQISPDVPKYIIVDKAKLQEILDRLLQNALKFTEKGEILIEVESSPIGIDRFNLTFKIKDTGIGISANNLEQIFQPFTMGDASSTRSYGGTGMGLAIVKRICQIMGATISVSSTLGQGTTFTVSLVLSESLVGAT